MGSGQGGDTGHHSREEPARGGRSTEKKPGKSHRGRRKHCAARHLPTRAAGQQGRGDEQERQPEAPSHAAPPGL